jgi:acyl carrier protein
VQLTSADVLDVVRDALVTVLEVDPARVTPDTALDSLDADSLALVEVAEIVEERLAPHARDGYAIPDTELEAVTTVGEAVELALARL